MTEPIIIICLPPRNRRHLPGYTIRCQCGAKIFLTNDARDLAEHQSAEQHTEWQALCRSCSRSYITLHQQGQDLEQDDITHGHKEDEQG